MNWKLEQERPPGGKGGTNGRREVNGWNSTIITEFQKLKAQSKKE